MMKKEQIEKNYKRLMDAIESMKIYDGRNTVDRYQCQKCGEAIHTTYKDKGVTPFCMVCPRCGGVMQHVKTFDKNVVPGYVKIKNWYRPTLEDTLKMSEGEINHILNGGLILEQ